MADERGSDPTGEVRRLYEEAESRTAQAFEEVVSRGSFGELLARVTANVVAVTKIGSDVFELMLRNLRLAGRQDMTRIARQLNRTEDKLELVLQEVERLHEELERSREAERKPPSRSSRPSRGSGNGRAADSSRSGGRGARGRT